MIHEHKVEPRPERERQIKTHFTDPLTPDRNFPGNWLNRFFLFFRLLGFTQRFFIQNRIIRLGQPCPEISNISVKGIVDRDKMIIQRI